MCAWEKARESGCMHAHETERESAPGEDSGLWLTAPWISAYMNTHDFPVCALYHSDHSTTFPI